jgi:hypothetical protein
MPGVPRKASCWVSTIIKVTTNEPLALDKKVKSGSAELCA